MSKCSFVLVAYLAAATLSQGYCSGDATRTRSGRSAENPLIFDNSTIVVNPNDPLNLECGVRVEFQKCSWVNSKEGIIELDDVYKKQYNHLSKPQNTTDNQCGIVVNPADMGHNGEWTCRVLVGREFVTNSKYVVVRNKQKAGASKLSAGAIACIISSILIVFC